MTIDQFVASTGITMCVDRTNSNPNMDDEHRDMRHWLCALRREHRSMRVPFSQGSAHTQEPTASDVLECLASDASGVDNAQSFDDWCAEYGYDNDSRKAEKTYKTCQRQADNLRNFLGNENFETLLYGVQS